MKRALGVFLLVMALVFSFAGCSDPQAPEITQPEAPTPTQTVAPSDQPSTEPTPPMHETPYRLTVNHGGRFVYREPSFEAEKVMDFPVGVYTIVEETRDESGNLWGRLKSGIGWVWVEQMEQMEPGAEGALVCVANSTLLKTGRYTTYYACNDGYETGFYIQALEGIQDIRVYRIHEASPYSTELLMQHDELASGDGLLAYLSIPMDFQELYIVFQNVNGKMYEYRIGEDYSGEGDPFIISRVPDDSNLWIDFR